MGKPQNRESTEHTGYLEKLNSSWTSLTRELCFQVRLWAQEQKVKVAGEDTLCQPLTSTYTQYMNQTYTKIHKHEKTNAYVRTARVHARTHTHTNFLSLELVGFYTKRKKK